MADDKELYLVTAAHPIDLADGRVVGPLDTVEIDDTKDGSFKHSLARGWLTKVERGDTSTRKKDR